MSDVLNRQLLRLGSLMQLERRVRRSGRDELPFIMVNETGGLVPCQAAMLWQANGTGGGRVAAVSGLAVFDPTGPYLTWSSQVLAHLAGASSGTGLRAVGPDDLPPSLAADWGSWWPAHALWVPLIGPGGLFLGGLLLARGEPWGDPDKVLLDHLSEAYAHAWLAKEAEPRRPHWMQNRRRLRRMAMATAGALLLLGVVPVRQTALAPAEVVPEAPTIVRAPLAGVVDRVHVQPNGHVEAGDVLFTLDSVELTSRYEVAAKARDAALAEYTQAAQMAVADPQAKSQVAVLEARLAQQELEVGYLRDMLARVTIVAPEAGIAVFDDPNDWLGRPVAVGERVMLVAQPERYELEIRLPAGDAISLETGAPVDFYPNAAPGRGSDATLRLIGYAASTGPDGVLAYRLKASLATHDGGLRIGQRGTAKVYGPRAPLLLALLRRPLATVSQWLSL